ncbi:MAG: hypothetical protein R3245_11525, partial [Kiloniellales bacterium]|nr:hypothetical protein [Kiloniellales bacterium]
LFDAEEGIDLEEEDEMEEDADDVLAAEFGEDLMEETLKVDKGKNTLEASDSDMRARQEPYRLVDDPESTG